MLTASLTRITRCFVNPTLLYTNGDRWCSAMPFLEPGFGQLLSLNLLSSAVLDVVNMLAGRSVGSAELVRASRLVAGLEVESANLIVAVLADGVNKVEQLVVLGSKAVGFVLDAAGNVVHAVGSTERKLAVVKKAATLAGGNELVVHVNTAALLRRLGGTLAGNEVVPSIIGDVVGTTRRVNLEEVDTAALV